MAGMSGRSPKPMPACAASSLKIPGEASSARGESSCPRRPCSSTMMRSECRTVCRRWAIVSTRQPFTSSLSTFWMRWSLSGSTLAVASSRHSTDVSLSRALARHSTCRSPTEKLRPPSATSEPRPPPKDSTNSRREQLRSASQSPSSATAPKGSRFLRRSPEKRMGSCGTMVTLLRSSARPQAAMSTSPSRMRPLSRPTIRSSAPMMVDFPEPVRPTMPTFSPPTSVAERWSRAGGR
mmetsp:Transcript_25960/g.77538  ORF Transcript_25960/g.77538 Transcript_25960/m.77538 type:complete len:237 (-) Transcript_25960:1589-2299(-)